MKIGILMISLAFFGVGIAAGWYVGPQNLPRVGTSALENALPVVVFIRPGLLTEKDRALLQERVINPIVDYYNETEKRLITMAMTVPAQSGEPYRIQSIFVDGVHEELSWGTRDGEIPYWTPNCLGECVFSESFRAKYPAVIENAVSH